MTKIADARQDENGKARGGQAGDQTGNEILVHDWYDRDGGWDVFLECTDREMAEAAAASAIDIAEDDSFGYDQNQRWTGANAIASAGDIFSAEDSEFDCSSFVDTVYAINGLEIERGYTGNLESRYLVTGKFVAHREAKYLKSADYATVGGLYLTAGKHVAIVVTDGSKSGSSAVTAENYASEADQIDPPYVQITGKVNVRFPAGKDGEIIYVARDEKLPFEEFDDDTGWWGVQCPKGSGFVSNKIPRYAKLVEE